MTRHNQRSFGINGSTDLDFGRAVQLELNGSTHTVSLMDNIMEMLKDGAKNLRKAQWKLVKIEQNWKTIWWKVLKIEQNRWWCKEQQNNIREWYNESLWTRNTTRAHHKERSTCCSCRSAPFHPSVKSNEKMNPWHACVEKLVLKDWHLSRSSKLDVFLVG